MSKFKVGDTVRVIDNQYEQHSLGHVANVTKIDDDGDVWIGNLCYSDFRIELVEEEKPEVIFDPVQKPNHYNVHPSGVECRTITRHESSNIGQAIQYIWRKDLKGSPIQDMQKSIECIQDEIDLYVDRLKKQDSDAEENK